MTPPSPPADLPHDDVRDDPTRRPLLDLSLTQLLGGALAAATGAALASRLGVAGTIIGAGAVSLFSAVGSAAYTQSLRRTRDRVRSAAQRTRPDRPPRRPAPPRRRAVRIPVVLAGAAAVFVIAFTAITGYELLTGQPISGDQGRTTLGRLATDDGADDPTRPADESDAPTSATTTPASSPAGSPSSASSSSSSSSAESSDPATSSAVPTTGEPTSPTAPVTTDPAPIPTTPPAVP